MAATTPWATCSMTEVPAWRGSRASATSGASAPTIPAVVATSNSDSTRTLPCSRVNRAAVASRSSASMARSQACCSTERRPSKPRAAQAGCDLRAATAAWSS